MKHRRVWERSVSLDEDGVGWVNGTRADFIWHLFMMGFSTVDLASGCSDGFMTATHVEDAIRFGVWQASRKSTRTKGSVR